MNEVFLRSIVSSHEIVLVVLFLVCWGTMMNRKAVGSLMGRFEGHKLISFLWFKGMVCTRRSYI